MLQEVTHNSVDRPLFITNNPNLGSTSRILESWLRIGREHDLAAAVVAQRTGDLVEWLGRHETPCLVDPLPWLDKKKPWIAVWHAMRVAAWARRQRSQVIHFNEHDVYPFARLLSRFLRVPIVCHVRYKLDRGFAEWAFGGRRGPDALLWTSHQQKADSSAAIDGVIPEHRQHVVRLGLDLTSFGCDVPSGRTMRQAWQVQDEEILVGIPAPLRPRKRVHDFIEVIQRLATKHPNVVGLIAGGEIEGDEEYRALIEQQVAASGLGRRLQWIGNLEPVEPFHHACDISISTSEYETFGNSVCEAMACGKPVVGYVGGSVAEVVGETGIVVPTGDIDALTAAVERLIIDPETRHGLGAAARQRVATEFSPAASLNQVRSIYDQIVAERAAANR